MLNKERDGEASPFDMLLVILLRMVSMVLGEVVMSSSLFFKCLGKEKPSHMNVLISFLSF